MENQHQKCKGVTIKGKPCNKFPLAGEEYCEKHHPKYKYKRWFRNAIIAQISSIVAIILFIIGRCDDKQTIEILKSEFERHSLADRILTSQYNPINLTNLLNEVLNLMNNDPDFKKTISIDTSGIGISTGNLVYNQNIKIDFNNVEDSLEFIKFLNRGYKNFSFNKEMYKVFYILKNGNVIDSIKNIDFNVERKFPHIPFINLSTISPTKEFLCTSLLDIQIDSITNNSIYLSNSKQNSTFKIKLQYDVIDKVFSFDQINDITFNNKSPFYSIDQEISYFEFLQSLISNARINIRNALTAESILTTENFIPKNIDSRQSFNNINNKLTLLHQLEKIEDSWGIKFQKSEISNLEYEYLKIISQSERLGSEVTQYPFSIKLPKTDVNKIKKIMNQQSKSNHNLICNANRITLLDEKLILGQLVIFIPPSYISYKYKDSYVNINFSPIDIKNKIILKYTELSEKYGPGSTIYYDPYILSQDSTAIIVNDIEILPECFEYFKDYEGSYFNRYK